MAQSQPAGRPGIGGQVRLERIYLKDASWESPRTPGVFAERWQPELQVDINSRVNALEEGRHEVVLSVTIRARVEGARTAFIVEVQQAGLFVVEGVEGGVLQRVLGTLCPTTLFPYAREAIDNLVVKGGFPPLHLAPVNFEALYAEALRRHEQGEPTGSDNPVTH
jgi:preprotein translocase subunit SecB